MSDRHGAGMNGRKSKDHLVKSKVFGVHLEVAWGVLKKPLNEVALLVTGLFIDDLFLLGFFGELGVHDGLEEGTAALAVLSELGNLGKRACDD